MDRLNYHYSGLSSREALTDSRQRSTEMLTDVGYPAFLAKLLSRFSSLSMHCDGAGCPRVGKTNGQPNAQGQWPHSGGWVHQADLDFCPSCQTDGRMGRAVASGQRPLGA